MASYEARATRDQAVGHRGTVSATRTAVPALGRGRHVPSASKLCGLRRWEVPVVPTIGRSPRRTSTSPRASIRRRPRRPGRTPAPPPPRPPRAPRRAARPPPPRRRGGGGGGGKKIFDVLRLLGA